MTDPNLEKSEARGLSALMAWGNPDGNALDAVELAAIWSHQLQTSLAVDLESDDLAEAKTVRAIISDAGGKIETFGDLLSATSPPMALLERVKAFAKRSRSNRDSPIYKELGTLLYYATIAAAAVRCGLWPTKLKPDALRRGLEWAADLSWADPATKSLCREAIDRISSTD